MELIEAGIFCFSLVSCIGICAGVYYLSEVRKAEIQQAGIDGRAVAKLGSEPAPYNRGEWWEPLLSEIVKNPEISKVITPYLPGLIEKFGIIKK
jgi:hypothetical protein